MSAARILYAVSIATCLAGCAASHPSQMPPGADYGQFVVDRSGDQGLEWRPDVCAQVDLHPDYRVLDETNLVDFLRSRQLQVRVERQPTEPHKPDLVFVFVTLPGSSEAVSLRVAVLPTADEAGKSLDDALAQRGSGVWGVHRSNLAVLGPAGSAADDVAFAAKTKLACWGTMTIADASDAFVVPGGYAEP